MPKKFSWFFGAACVALVAAGSATAADLPTRMYTKAPPIPQDYNWNGFYVGGNFGGGWGKQSASQLLTGVTTPIIATPFQTGFIGGGQAGYNFQFGHWVIGLEADYQGSAQQDSASLATATTALAGTYTDKINSFGTVRGRMGYALADHGNWLPYVTAGWAYARASISGTATSAFSQSANYSGWTVGTGFEWAFLQHLTWKVEYLYMGLGNGPTVPIDGASGAIIGGKLTDNILRSGFNYKF
jgi:outer membrane immunogenic protein